MDSREEITCPACGERTLAVAQKCKHCGEWRTATAPPPVPPPAPPAGALVTPPLPADAAQAAPAAPPAQGMSLPKALAIGCGVVAAVIIGFGVLAAIAIPKFSGTKEKAIQASLKADLRNLATAQETYFARYGRWVSDVSELSPDYFIPAPDVTITIRPIQPDGWEAFARHSGASSVLCQLRYGDVGAPDDGVPKCTTGR